MNRHRLAAVVSLALVVGGCSGSGGSGAGSGTSGTAPDTTAPTVLSVVPGADATDVPLATSVTVTFSEPMRAATLTGATITVDDGDSLVSGTVTPSDHAATFTPAAALAAGRTYTVTVTTGAQDAAGNPLAATFTSSFSTAPPARAALLFGKSGALYRVDENGTHLALVAPSPATYLGISPAGDVVYRSSGTDLWSVRPDGTGRVQLEAAPAGDWIALVGFTSAHRLVYSIDRGLTGHGDLYAVNADGSDPVALASTGTVDISEDHAVVVNGRVVYMLDPDPGVGDQPLHSVLGDGTGDLLLVGGDTLGSQKQIVHVSAAGQVFYARSYSASDDTNLYEVDAGGTGAATLAASADRWEVFLGQAPNGAVAVGSCQLPCSGFGSEITRLLLDGRPVELDRPASSFGGFTSDNYFVVQLDSASGGRRRAIRTLSSGGDAAFDFDANLETWFVAAHPDHRILYGATDIASGQVLGVFSASADAGLTVGPVKLLDPGDEFVRLAPDGRVVYWRSGALYSVDVDGMNRRLLRQPTGFSFELSGYTPGGKVVYAESSGAGYELFIVDHDGSAPVNLTNGPSPVAPTFLTTLP